MANEKESSLLIAGPVGALEVSINVGQSGAKFADQGCWAVICHPHPLHGGTKENKVVTTLMRSYRDLGISVVRFNFRGVGQSVGQFDHGKGELQDVEAVMTWLMSGYSPKSVCLAGFSFGSSIAARACFLAQSQSTRSPIAHLVLVAPPVERYEYDREGLFPQPVCIIQGGHDELVNSEGVYNWAEQLQSPMKLIRYPDATHFFHGYLSQLKEDLTLVLEHELPLAKKLSAHD